MALQMKIKYFSEDAKRLMKIDKGDWIDVYANKDIIIHQGECTLVPLGFAMQLPVGYEAYLLPRSSTFKKWGILVANSMGVIDESYCGDTDEWKLSAYCMKPNCPDAGYTMIKKGDKIAQFRIQEKMPAVEFIEVDSLGNESRGGFGSTGSV